MRQRYVGHGGIQHLHKRRHAHDDRDQPRIVFRYPARLFHQSLPLEEAPELVIATDIWWTMMCFLVCRKVFAIQAWSVTLGSLD